MLLVLQCAVITAQENRVGVLPQNPNERLFQTGLLVGHYGLLDEYMSPNVYTGVALGAVGNRSRMLKRHPDWLFCLNAKCVVGIATGPSGNGRMNAYMGDGRLAFQRVWSIGPDISLTAGPQLYVKVGGITNMRNSNNVAQLKLHVAAAATGEAVWRFSIGNYPMALSWEFDLPVLGYGFSPTYGLQYYEIAYLNRLGEASHLVWPGNMFAMTHYASVMIPAGHLQLKFSYVGDYHSSDIGNVKCRMNENSFLVSLVKRFEKRHNGR